MYIVQHGLIFDDSILIKSIKNWIVCIDCRIRSQQLATSVRGRGKKEQVKAMLNKGSFNKLNLTHLSIQLAKNVFKENRSQSNS